MSYESGPWIGASGTEYLYHVFDIDAQVPPRMGNYIYCKQNPQGLWAPIYMGEGDLASRCTDPRILGCIKRKQATHVHLKLNSRLDDRIEELKDLLSRYKNAFQPDGCHEAEDRPAMAFTALDSGN